MRFHRVVDDWLKNGRSRPRPGPVIEHLDSCEACATGLIELDRLRDCFDSIDDLEPPLSETSTAAIRFHLQSVARLPQTPVAGPEGRGLGRRRWRLGVLLAAAALALGAVWLGPFATMEGEAAREAVAVVDVESLSGKAARRVGLLPEESYVVEHGVVRFSVPKLAAGQRVSVRVGADVVIVHGTRFLVEAVAGQLESVKVEQGRVSLEFDGGLDLALTAGQTWKRSETRESEPVDVVPRPTIVSTDVPPPASAAAATIRPAVGAARSIPRAPKAQLAGTPTAKSARRARNMTTSDSAFSAAWGLYREGRFDAASLAFDALLDSQLGARRPDILFWSGESHLRAGRRESGVQRLVEMLEKYPDAWHAAHARESLRRLGLDGSRVRSKP